MIRRLIFALGLSALLSGTPAVAQNFTAVSGTILDPNSLPYSNCAITAELVPAGTNPTINGAAIGGLNRASCDVNGNFSMTLGSNAVILPGGTQWKFTVTEIGIAPPAGFGPQSFSTIITISGASQNISAALAVPALALARTGAGGTLAGVQAADTAFRANGPIGTNWTQTSNGFTISGNSFVGTSAGLNSAFWASNSFSNLQFSQAVIFGLNGVSEFPGVSILNQPTGANFYSCVENSTTILLQKVVNGVPTTLASTASAGVAGDLLRLEIWPSQTLLCTKNNLPILSAIDSTFTLGSPGIVVTGPTAAVDYFLGGNIFTTWHCGTVTPATVNANVSTDQLLLSCIVPAGLLAAPARRLEIQLIGVYSTPAASTTAVTVKAQLCTVAGCGSGTVQPLVSITSSTLASVQATNNPFTLEAVALAEPGALVSFEAHGGLTIVLGASASGPASVFRDTNTAPTGNINDQLQLFLQTTIAFSVASASNSATARELFLRVTE